MNAASPVSQRVPRVGEIELERLRAIVGDRLGLRFDERNRELLVDGIVRAAAAERITPSELVARLERSDDLLPSLVPHITIGETYFFRHPEHFSLLADLVVPSVSGRADETVRAWSAGCSTGEEAWSLAIALSDACARRTSVLGTDINPAALATARSGRYGRWSLRGRTPSRDLVETSDGGVVVSPGLREAVRFEQHNLHRSDLPGGFDVIFCRNVLVYLRPDAASAILTRLAGALVEGGYLVVTALDVDRAPPGLEVIFHRETLVLRRRGAQLSSRRPVTSDEPVVRPPSPPSLPSPPSPPRKTPRVSNSSLIAGARQAADSGDLDRAIELLRRAVSDEPTSEALLLLAMVLGERGEAQEAEATLGRMIAQAPGSVLGHLALGLADGDRAARRAHLQHVVKLLDGRRDDELLPGPEPLSVAWVRGLATAGLEFTRREK
jgi:chemotaxis protein methyltransferase CheR